MARSLAINRLDRSPVPRPSRHRALTRRRWLLVIAAIGVAALVFASGVDRTAARARDGEHCFCDRLVSTEPTRDGFRIATFNIHSCRDLDGRPSLDRITRVLRDLAPDFVGLQEVRGAFSWSQSQAEKLVGAEGFGWCFAPSERRWWHDHFGNGALSTLPTGAWRTVSLKNTRGRGYRSYLQCRIDVGKSSVCAIVAHLDNRTDRQVQLRVVLDAFLALPPPAFLAGDLNTTASDPLLAAVLARDDVVDAIAGVKPAQNAGRIDWILLRGLEPYEGGVLDTSASDHPCVWAGVRIAVTDGAAAESRGRGRPQRSATLPFASPCRGRLSVGPIRPAPSFGTSRGSPCA